MAFQVILSKNQIQLPLQRGNISPGDTIEVLLINIDSSYASATATFSMKKGKANQDLTAIANDLPAFINTGTLSQVFDSIIINNRQIFTIKPAQSSALDLLSNYIVEVQITKSDTTVESWQIAITTGQDLVGNATPADPAQPFVRFLGSFATASTGATGDMYYNTTDSNFYFYRSSWQILSGGGGGGIPDGDKGDITVSGGGTVWTIDNQAVTRAKLEHIQTGHVLGRHASGTNDVQEVSPVQLRTILNVENGAQVNNISDVNATDLTDGGNTTLHTHDSRYYTESEIDALLSAKQNTLGFTPENIANKNANNGYAPLDAGGKVPLANLPGTLLKYVGIWNASTNTPTLTSPDLTKVGNVYNVSVAGTRFSINWSLGDWLIYNESGVPEKSDNSDDVTSVNGQQGTVVLTQDNVGDGTTYKQYSQTEKTKLAGIEAGAEVNTVDSVAGKTGAVTLVKADVDLGNVDNTSDLNKPISTATQTALNAKENTITAGTTSQYYRGDKTFQTLDKIAIGLGNVDNTSDVNKPVSTATQTALNLKQNSLGYTAENQANKTTSIVGNETSNVLYATVKAVYDWAISLLNLKRGIFPPLLIEPVLMRVGPGISGSQIAGANTIYYQVVNIAEPTTAVGINVLQNTVVAGNIQVALYQSSASNKNSINIALGGATKLIESGSVVMTGSGSFPLAQYIPFTSSLLIQPGLYWLAIQYSNATATFTRYGNFTVYGGLGYTSTPGSFTFPATAPTGTATNNGQPVLLLVTTPQY